jgi:hypothetical protein
MSTLLGKYVVKHAKQTTLFLCCLEKANCFHSWQELNVGIGVAYIAGSYLGGMVYGLTALTLCSVYNSVTFL